MSSEYLTEGDRQLAEGRKRALEAFESGKPLEVALDELLGTIERLATTPLLASILVLDESGKRLYHGSAPSLPKSYCDAIDGIRVGPTVGSCGTAVYCNIEVMVRDISKDPLWADFRDIALAHDLRACWSAPIRSSRGRVLGTFALYHRVPVAPAAADRQLVADLSATAAEILERARDRKLGRAQEASSSG